MISHRSARASEAHWGTVFVSDALPLGLFPLLPFFAGLPGTFAVSRRPSAPQPCRTSRPAGLRGSENVSLLPALAEIRRGRGYVGPPPTPRTARVSLRSRGERTTTSTRPAVSSPWSLCEF